MSRGTTESAAFRIAEHAATHGIKDIDVVLHGGEPLLAGPTFIEYAANTLRAALHDCNSVRISVQTNGLLLDAGYLELLARLDIKVGLSMDGSQAAHDRHRRKHDGTATFGRVAEAASLLAGYPHLFSGLLSVIDLDSDPVRAYESLVEFAPPVIDFLLPHGNWSAPPPAGPTGTAHPYGSWLGAVFDRWYQAPRMETSIRLFTEIMNLLLGGSSGTAGIGISPVSVIVVESDGDITGSDTEQAAAPASAATGRNVVSDSFDSVLFTPGTAARQAGLSALCAQCRECPVAHVCGGGLYAHRYRADSRFDNPSVYCHDLYHLITHIRARLVADLGHLIGDRVPR
jgi:uncharacterized protein